jgi:hypothetical protein
MRHTRAGFLMSLYLDQRLDAPATRQLERHLAECASCRRDMARLRLAEPALREADPVAWAQVPVDLAERIAQRVAAYEAQRAADLARARRRREARAAAQAAFWRGPGWRLAVMVSALIVALGVWWRTYPENGLAGAVTRMGPDVMQWLATPGPSGIAWSVWIAMLGLALGAGGWLARADASAEWRRSLGEWLPRVW